MCMKPSSPGSWKIIFLSKPVTVTRTVGDHCPRTYHLSVLSKGSFFLQRLVNPHVCVSVFMEYFKVSSIYAVDPACRLQFIFKSLVHLLPLLLTLFGYIIRTVKNLG